VSLQIDDNPEELRYEALLDGQLAGFIQYQLRDGRITMYHTEVDPAYEGHGIGSELAKVALADVLDRGLELAPLCPFIANYIRLHAEDYLGMVPTSMREKVLAGG
jgi:predicted GNAT family acetyltransferase